jgi:predicted RNA methylase
LNDEGWYSVTPEHLADKITNRIIEQLRLHDQEGAASTKKYHLMDAFCGPGGNVLSFARHQSGVSHVTTVDISKDMLRIANHNASIYQVPAGSIRFVEGDILRSSEELKHPSRSKLRGDWSVKHIDAIFMSPPWGGTKYKKREGDEGFETAPAFDLDAMPVPMYVFSIKSRSMACGERVVRDRLSIVWLITYLFSASIIAAAKPITPNLAIMLPPTTDPEDVKKHLDGLPIEIEQYIVDGVLKV